MVGFCWFCSPSFGEGLGYLLHLTRLMQLMHFAWLLHP